MTQTAAVTSLAERAILGALVVLAVALRLYHLDHQILGGDELHVLSVVASVPLGSIPGYVGEYDYSIPLALLYALLAKVAPLSEWTLRAPMLIAGAALPVAAWYAFRRSNGAGVTLAVCALLAVHPFTILYARFVRPYGIVLVPLLLAYGALDRAAHDGKKKRLVLAVAAAGFAIWLNIPALIGACAIFAGALVAAASSDATMRLRRVCEVAVAGCAAVAMAALLYAPALRESIRVVFEQKVGSGTVTADVLWRAAEVLTGAPSHALVLTFAALVVAGGIVAAFGDGLRAARIIVPAVVIPAAILVSTPQLLEYEITLPRYVLNALPFFLLLAARAIAAAFARVRSPVLHRAAPYAGIAAALALLCAGPYFTIYRPERAYAHHAFFQGFGFVENPDFAGPRTAPYAAAAAAPLVLSWPPAFGFQKNGYYALQERHGRRLQLLIEDEPPFAAPCFAWRNIVRMPPTGLPDVPPGTIVLLHRNPASEKNAGQRGVVPPRMEARKPTGFERLSARFTESCGRPCAEDVFVRAFRVP